MINVVDFFIYLNSITLIISFIIINKNININKKKLKTSSIVLIVYYKDIIHYISTLILSTYVKKVTQHFFFLKFFEYSSPFHSSGISKHTLRIIKNLISTSFVCKFCGTFEIKHRLITNLITEFELWLKFTSYNIYDFMSLNYD